MSESWTVRRVLDWTRDYFRRGGIEASRLEAEILLGRALRIDRVELYLQPDRILTESERLYFRRLIQQRRAGTPLQYLIGEIDFFNCRLKVSPAALIPRPETEELVERIVHDLAARADQPLRVLDLGTGTGAIAIALARAFTRAEVLAADLSAEALELAQQNAQENGVADRVRFAQSDWFENIAGAFDLIVSNPPYVRREDLAGLQREVQQEPRLALDGGPGGLESIAHIIGRSGNFLKPEGLLYLEIGEGQAAAVRDMLDQTKAFDRLDVLQDTAGKERFTRAVRASTQVLVNH